MTKFFTLLEAENFFAGFTWRPQTICQRKVDLIWFDSFKFYSFEVQFSCRCARIQLARPTRHENLMSRLFLFKGDPDGPLQSPAQLAEEGPSEPAHLFGPKSAQSFSHARQTHTSGYATQMKQKKKASS